MDGEFVSVLYGGDGADSVGVLGLGREVEGEESV